MRLLAQVVALSATAMLVGCGRLDFESHARDASTDSDIRVDAADSDVPMDARVDGVVEDAGDAGDTGVMPPATDAVFRSVGPDNTSPLATGAMNALQIAGGVARFASPLPDRVGVGDVLSYDSNGDATIDALAFVHGRISSTAYFVANERGEEPPATAEPNDAWSLHRAYTSLDDAVDGSVNPAVPLPFDEWTGGNDLLALGKSWHVACYGDAPDVARVRVEGWVTSSSTLLKIFTPTAPSEVGARQRHEGRWDANRYHLVTPPDTNDLALDVLDADVWIEGLQIRVASDSVMGDLPYGIQLREGTPGRTGWITGNIIDGSGTPQRDGSIPRGIKLSMRETGHTFYVWNNIIYDFGGGGTARAVEITGPGTTAYLYNNTMVNCVPSVYGNDTADVLYVTNNIAFGCGIECFRGRGGYIGTNNRSSDDSAAAEGIGTRLSSSVPTDYFVADGDYRLSEGASAIGELVDVGANLSTDDTLPFDEDVNGDPRGEAWDIGADEL